MTRKDKSSKIESQSYTNVSGYLVKQTLLDGVLHSVDDNPAEIATKDDSIVYSWYSHGLIHRPEEFGPAKIKNSEKFIYKEYCYMGNMHRLNGPAFISPYEILWVQHNLLHREDGPASIVRTADQTYYDWYLRGKRFVSFEAWAAHANIDDELFLYIKLKYG